MTLPKRPGMRTDWGQVEKPEKTELQDDRKATSSKKADPKEAVPSSQTARKSGWISSQPSGDGKTGQSAWPSSLDDLFLFDPNFESCW
jgi:hypothetical protein